VVKGFALARRPNGVTSKELRELNGTIGWKKYLDRYARGRS